MPLKDRDAIRAELQEIEAVLRSDIGRHRIFILVPPPQAAEIPWNQPANHPAGDTSFHRHGRGSSQQPPAYAWGRRYRRGLRRVGYPGAQRPPRSLAIEVRG